MFFELVLRQADVKMKKIDSHPKVEPGAIRYERVSRWSTEFLEKLLKMQQIELETPIYVKSVFFNDVANFDETMLLQFCPHLPDLAYQLVHVVLKRLFLLL